MATHPPADRPPTIDPVAAARWAQHLPPAGEAASPWLHEEIGRRMEDRLQWITAQPRHWIDWAPGVGGLEAHARVAGRYRDARAFVVEPEPAHGARTAAALAAPWWTARRWQTPTARFEAPPDDGVDMLWANMALHMAADPQALIQRWHRLVATDGFLMFSCLGPDTVQELRALYRRQGWPPAGHDLTDMHDWGDMLVHVRLRRAGDGHGAHGTLSFTSARGACWHELRGLGRNLHRGALRQACAGGAWRAAARRGAGRN